MFDEEASKLCGVDFLARGAIYLDVVECAAPAPGEARVSKYRPLMLITIANNDDQKNPTYRYAPPFQPRAS